MGPPVIKRYEHDQWVCLLDLSIHFLVVLKLKGGGCFTGQLSSDDYVARKIELCESGLTRDNSYIVNLGNYVTGF